MGERFTLNSDNRILGGTKCITILHNSNVNKYSVAPKKTNIIFTLYFKTYNIFLYFGSVTLSRNLLAILNNDV